MDTTSFVYVIYINATAETVWRALTDAELTRRYWSNHRNASDWSVGSTWRHEDYDHPGIVDIMGRVVTYDRPRRLVLTWRTPREEKNGIAGSCVQFDVAEDRHLVRLTLTHGELRNDDEARGVALAWPMVLSGLKTLLETGDAMPPTRTREDGHWSKTRFAEPS